MSGLIANEIVKQLEALPGGLQRQVLEYVQRLKASGTSGVPGKELVRFAGVIPPDDLERMREAIESGCERVYLDGA